MLTPRALTIWFSSSANSNDDHGNVKHVKDVTEDVIVRKSDSPALCEVMRKPDAHAAPSYSGKVSKPAASTSRQSADYAPAALVSKSRSAKLYTRSTTNLLSRKVNHVLMMLACTF